MGNENVRSLIRKRALFFLVMTAVFLAVGGTAHAFNSYLTTFNATYGTSGTKLNSCSTCHGAGGTSTWNPYGQALRGLILTGSSISAALAAIEPLDADGDTYSNIVEITARTFPGDPADFPAPSDTTPPTVSSTNPANGQTEVAVNTAVTATFGEAVKNVTTTTFQLKAGAASVTGTVTLNGTTATFTPSAPLAHGTTYAATLTTGVTDLANNALAAAYSWSFTTGAAADTTPPTVSATSPVNGATAVSVNAAVTAIFSETIDASSVNATTFTVKDGAGAAVAGVVTASGNTATFTPSAALTGAVTYTATLSTGVKDLAGNALAAAHSWSFATIAASVDSDDDGVSDAEDDYPRDDRIATPHNPMGEGKITVDTSENSGTRLRGVTAMSDAASAMSQSGKPSGVNFMYGILSYRVEGVVPGAMIRVKITFPANIPPGSKAYKVDSSGFHEYSHVSFDDKTMTVTVTDGGAGDSDGSANGVIVDPIALATPADAPQSSGGGCSISGAGGKSGSAATSYGMLLLLAVAMLGARAAVRKARRR